MTWPKTQLVNPYQTRVGAARVTATELGLHSRDLSLFAADSRLSPQRATITVGRGRRIGNGLRTLTPTPSSLVSSRTFAHFPECFGRDAKTGLLTKWPSFSSEPGSGYEFRFLEWGAKE